MNEALKQPNNRHAETVPTVIPETPDRRVFDWENPDQPGFSPSPESYDSPDNPPVSAAEVIGRDREALDSKPPKVLIIPGAGARKSTLKDTVKAFREEGLDAHVAKPYYERARKIKVKKGQKRFQDAKVGSVVEQIDELAGEGEEITLLGHSLGGIIAARAALRRPYKVKTVILSNSEGISTVPKTTVDTNTGKLKQKEARPENMPFTRLGGRFLLETLLRKNNTLTPQGLRQTGTGALDIALHPLSFVGNAVEGARTNAMPTIARLKELGVDVHSISSNADMVYPASRSTEAIFSRQKDGELPLASASSYYATKPRLGSKEFPREWVNRTPRTDEERKEFKAAMAGVKSRRHRLAGEFAGHDQPIIYPRYVAKAVRQIIKPNEFEPSSGEKFSLIQRATVAAKGGMLDIKEKLNEKFVSGENTKRNRLIAAGVGVVAAAGAFVAAKKFNIDLPFDIGGNNGEPESAGTATINSEAQPVQGLDIVPEPRGDISANLNLPDGYISETADGYEVTAMRGNNTDSNWSAAEHALTDYLGQQPDVVQTDALKDILGEHLLDVGDKVSISNEQIEKALETAKR